MIPRKFIYVISLSAAVTWIASIAYAQDQSPDFQGISTREIIIFVGCMLLIIGWLGQILMVRQKIKEMDASKDSTKSTFSSAVPHWFTPHRWAFVLIVILLPVGLSLLSRTLPFEQHEYLPGLAYHFAASIFIIMITLEITAIYNLPDDEWRPMLTAALTIDLLAFVAFSLIGEPTAEDTVYGQFMIAFFLLCGAVSFVSSFLTLYFARAYEQHRRGELPTDVFEADVPETVGETAPSNGPNSIPAEASSE